MSRLIKALSFVSVIGLTSACKGRESTDRAAAAVNCDDPHVRQLVHALGERFRQVSLLAPDSAVVREIREAYAPYVAPELLARWVSAPRTAPVVRRQNEAWRISSYSAQPRRSVVLEAIGDSHVRAKSAVRAFTRELAEEPHPLIPATECRAERLAESKLEAEATLQPKAGDEADA